jgi:hypothetical protein
MFWQRIGILFALTCASLFGSVMPAKAETVESKNSATVPTPGTISTTAADLTTEPMKPGLETANSDSSTTTVAQTPIDPGRPTRGVSSYIGVGGNIGLGGDSALGDSGFTVFSKIGLTPTFSVRPSVIIEDDPVVLIPVTYDFNLRSPDALDNAVSVAPYAGAGIAIETSGNADVGLLLTGGIDVPISNNFTATAAVNAAFLDETDVGFMIGIGYNFNRL